MRIVGARPVIVLLGLTLSWGCSSDYRVDVANGAVEVDRSFWSAMEDPEAFASNFEARAKRQGEEHNQVLTIFKSPIRDDQRVGIELAPGTWAEFMSVNPPAVTLQLRVAHAGHWVMSRQTFAKRGAPRTTPDAPQLNHSQEEAWLLSVYSDEVARTRSVLDALVAR
jgi:hypothetical protein